MIHSHREKGMFLFCSKYVKGMFLFEIWVWHVLGMYFPIKGMFSTLVTLKLRVGCNSESLESPNENLGSWKVDEIGAKSGQFMMKIGAFLGRKQARFPLWYLFRYLVSNRYQLLKKWYLNGIYLVSISPKWLLYRWISIKI